MNLIPGQKGTKKLVEIYGKSLLYVRYRYDENRGVRLKTVEIVVEEKPWQPKGYKKGYKGQKAIRVRSTDNRLF